MASSQNTSTIKDLLSFGRRLQKNGQVRNILEYDRLIFACNAQKCHYFLIMVDIQDAEITCYDSLHEDNAYKDSRKEYCKLVKDYITAVAQEGTNNRIAKNGWKIDSCAKDGVPTQPNTNDCGVYV